MFFFPECELKKALRDHDTDASSIVWTLIDNGKWANLIVRQVAIVVKSEIK